MDVAIDAVLQAIAGTLGSAVVAGVIKEHSTRFFLNLVAGGIGGGIGGFLLHSRIPALVNGGGEPNIDASAAPMT